VDEAGERSFTYWRAQSAARAMLGPGGIDIAALEGFDALFLSGITLAILPPEHRAALVAMAGRMRAAGKLVAFDSNFRARLWADGEEARAAMAAVWAVTGLALPSRDDEAALWGPEAPEALFRRLGVAEGVLKDGAAGPWTWDGVRAIHHPLPPAPRVVDSTAAGDGFNAGYLAACLQGEAPEAAARSGHAQALKILGQPGAIIPREPEA
jgi:2-dehydro-3-deoxygluconokinase